MASAWFDLFELYALNIVLLLIFMWRLYRLARPGFKRGKQDD